jgi:hypothetical protein
MSPAAGEQYVYLRDAYHPLIAFLYGWALLFDRKRRNGGVR